MKHNKHTERIVDLKDEIKAVSANLDWALRQNNNLVQKNNELESKNYRLGKIARHNGLVLVLMGMMLNLCKDKNDDATITHIKNAIMKYYKEMAQIIILPEEKSQSDDDEEIF